MLFLCTGNSCRSQMAERWTRRLKGDRVEPYSAGVDPGTLDPRAVAVMREAGVDISGHFSRALSEVIHIPFDVVVTVCDHGSEAVRYLPAERRWSTAASMTRRASRQRLHPRTRRSATTAASGMRSERSSQSLHSPSV